MKPCARSNRRARASGLLLGAWLATALLFCGCESRASREALPEQLARLNRPNLVLIVVDTLRADFTSPYGFERDTSPELARWAQAGVLFEEVRAQSSWTKMSMASVLTSLWPRTHGIHSVRDGLAESAVTLAEVLHTAGYRTYAVQTNGWLHQSFGFHQGFERYSFPLGTGAVGIPRPNLWAHADRVYAEAERLIDAHDGNAPFFLYLHFMDIHEYAEPYEFKTFGRDDRGHYLGAIRWVDHVLERLRRKLARAGILDDSVLLLTSDHGEEFGEHGVTGHARNVLTPVTRVPLVLRFPFELEALRVTTQVRSLDIAPTLLEIAGVPIPTGFEGESLLPLVLEAARTGAADRGGAVNRISFAALGTPLFRDAAVQASLTDGDWTFARNIENGAPEPEFLYDRRVDPREQVNLIEREREQADRLRKALSAHREEQAAPKVRRRDLHIAPEIADRLRAMGYLE